MSGALRVVLGLAVLALAGAGLVGCGGGGGGSGASTTAATLNEDAIEITAGSAAIVIPAGALDRSIAPAVTQVAAAEPAMSPLVPAGSAVEVDIGDATLSRPATISFTIPAAEADRFGDDNLVVARLEGQTAAALASTARREGGNVIVSAETLHFSTYGLFAFDLTKAKLVAKQLVDLDIARFLEVVDAVSSCKESSQTSPELKVDNTGGNSILEACIESFDLSGKRAEIVVTNLRTFAVEYSVSSVASTNPNRVLDAGASERYALDLSGPTSIEGVATSLTLKAAGLFLVDVACSLIPFMDVAKAFAVPMYTALSEDPRAAGLLGKAGEALLGGDAIEAVALLEAAVGEEAFLQALYDAWLAVGKELVDEVGVEIVKEVTKFVDPASVMLAVDSFVDAMERGGWGRVLVTWQGSGAPPEPTPTAAVPAVKLPAGLEPYQQLVDTFLEAMRTGDREILRGTFGKYLASGDWVDHSGKLDPLVSVTDEILDVFLSGIVVESFGAIGVDCASGATCYPHYGLVLSGWEGKAIDGFWNPSDPPESVLLIFRSERFPDQGAKFISVSPREPVSKATSIPSPNTAPASPQAATGAAFEGFEGLLFVDIPGDCLNVRDEPGLSTTVIGCEPDGSLRGRVGGPAYVDGKYWWKIPEGWVVEDFLRLVYYSECPGTAECGPPAGQFGMFAHATVNLPGDCLNAHSGPGIEVRLTACIPHGTALTIFSDGEQRDGHTWWWVVADQGSVAGCRDWGGCGWVSERYLALVD